MLLFLLVARAPTGTGRVTFYSANPFPGAATNIPVTIERNILHKFLGHYRAVACQSFIRFKLSHLFVYILTVLLPPLLPAVERRRVNAK